MVLDKTYQVIINGISAIQQRTKSYGGKWKCPSEKETSGADYGAGRFSSSLPETDPVVSTNEDDNGKGSRREQVWRVLKKIL